MKKLLQFIVMMVIALIVCGCATGLIGAAKNGDVTKLQKLLDAGADINESGLSGNCNGPALAHAAYYCQPEAVRYLLKRGADIEAVGAMMGGNRPLHLAAGSDCLEAVKVLLDAGADINAKAMRGSALAIAAMEGNIKVVKYLLERGADVDDAMTALRKRNDRNALALLEKYGQPQMAAKNSGESTGRPVIKSDVDTLPVWTSPPRPDDFAVVIGVEKYAELPKSDYSEIDARIMKRYLMALGFQEQNIDLITDEKATKSAIEKSLEAWLPNQTDQKSTVVIYFSGHGAPEPATGDTYLVPYDGDPNYLPQTGYPLKRLYEQLGKLPAKEIIVVLDSCFSGAGGRSVLAKGTRPLVMMSSMAAPPNNTVVLTASRGTQISTSSPDKRHGVFTYYFLKALQEGQNDIAGIFENLGPRVEREAKRLNVLQNPSISPDTEKLKGRFRLRK